jgi:hypothetical protein
VQQRVSLATFAPHLAVTWRAQTKTKTGVGSK